MESSSGGNGACAVVNAGQVYCWGYNGYGQFGNGQTDTNVNSSPVLVSGLPSNMASVSVGTTHVCAVTATGDVYCWGANTGNTTSYNPSVALGQLGNNSGIDSPVPVQVQGLSGPVTSVSAGNETTCAVMQDTTAECWGNNNFQQLGGGAQTVNSFLPVQVSGLTGVNSISNAMYTSCATLTNGSAYCWGINNTNNLSPGTPWWSQIPVQVQLP